MKFSIVVITQLILLLQTNSAFLVAPSPSFADAHRTKARSLAIKSSPNSKDADKPKWKPNPLTLKGMLQILITGSPDGVMLIGKPQINWSTGKKEYTASKGPKKLNFSGGKKDTKTKK
jgi:hypothetical protein